jgi:diguanylate cyclase (GGDEF)-like protein/PAS domain S-box-containing protein
MNPASHDDRDFRTIAQRVAVLAAIVGICCWWSITFTRGPAGVSTLWLASGVLCGVLLTTPRNRWPAYVVAASAADLAVRIAHGDAWYSVAVLGMASALEGYAVAFLVMRYADDPADVSHIQRTAWVATASALLVSALSALVAATTLAVGTPAMFAPVFGSWFASHMLGMAVFATLTGVARTERSRLLGRPGRRLELVLTIAMIALTCLALFMQSTVPLLFAIHPVLLLAVLRHRFSAVVFGTVIVAVIAISATFSGHGPFMLIDVGHLTLRILLLQLFIASTCMVTIPVAVVLTERAWLSRRLRTSEYEYRMLAEYSRDLVVRFDANGVRRYISPSATEMLGWTREEMREPRWDLVHPADAPALKDALAKLYVSGGATTILFRVRHKDGHYISIEAYARLVPGLRPGDPPEIIYSGRDVTRRVEAERALERNQRRLRAITDNLPAFVIHVDLEEKYTFANAYTGKVLDVDVTRMVGRPVREVMGETIYASIKRYMDAAFDGITVTFEIERDFQGRHHHYQSTYVPDVGADGAVQGFYAVTFDISKLKLAERALERLARYDTLTGLANRLHFKERIELAIMRHQRTSRPIALLYLDIDHFKHINDTFGHAVGDAVLCEFAQRLGESVRATDFAARLGGDEFVVLIEDVDEVDAVETVARKLIGRMRDRVGANGHLLVVTTSIGIAFCRRPVANPDALMQTADAALYEAKAAGRNTYRVAV